MRPSSMSLRTAVLLGAEHVDVLAVLVGEHGLVVDQQRVELAAALQLHAREQARA